MPRHDVADIRAQAEHRFRWQAGESGDACDVRFPVVGGEQVGGGEEREQGVSTGCAFIGQASEFEAVCEAGGQAAVTHQAVVRGAAAVAA